MASTAETSKRRQTVGELWVRGVPVPRIAAQLQATERTIRRDVKLIREQLAAERLQDLAANRDRAVAVLRKVQQEAWTLFARIDDRSTNKIGALNSILQAEMHISKLEGTSGTDIKIDSTATIDISVHPEFQLLQNRIVAALEKCPQDVKLMLLEAISPMDEFSAHLN